MLCFFKGGGTSVADLLGGWDQCCGSLRGVGPVLCFFKGGGVVLGI